MYNLIIKLVGEDGSKIPQIQKFDSMYSEDDLVLDYLIEADDDEEVDEVEEDSETNLITGLVSNILRSLLAFSVQSANASSKL